MSLATSQYRSVAPARIEQRAAERHSVKLHRATVRGHGRTAIEAELVDLSAYGCRITADQKFNEGERIWLRFSDAKPLAATTIWSDGHKFGCRFDEQLDRALFRELTLVIR
jgi:hypothetical protein